MIHRRSLLVGIGAVAIVAAAPVAAAPASKFPPHKLTAYAYSLGPNGESVQHTMDAHQCEAEDDRRLGVEFIANFTATITAFSIWTGTPGRLGDILCHARAADVFKNTHVTNGMTIRVSMQAYAEDR